jgi:hypothetical protein
MGFSAQKYRHERQEKPWKINPVWRGIGCFFILLIPIMAWYAALLYLQSDPQIPMVQDMDKPIIIRYSHIVEIDRIIADFNRYTVSHNLVAGQFFLTIILIVIGYGFLAFIYALLYSIAGPPRYGPFDVPPDAMRR